MARTWKWVVYIAFVFIYLMGSVGALVQGYKSGEFQDDAVSKWQIFNPAKQIKAYNEWFIESHQAWEGASNYTKSNHVWGMIISSFFLSVAYFTFFAFLMTFVPVKDFKGKGWFVLGSFALASLVFGLLGGFGFLIYLYTGNVPATLQPAITKVVQNTTQNNISGSFI